MDYDQDYSSPDTTDDQWYYANAQHTTVNRDTIGTIRSTQEDGSQKITVNMLDNEDFNGSR